MPRALRGRFEPVDHFARGHLAILAPLPALGTLYAAKWFIDLAIVVRTRSRALRDLCSLVHESHHMSLRQFIPAVIAGLLLAALLLWLTLGWLLDAITLPVGERSMSAI